MISVEAQPFLFSDLHLARRLERVEGRSNADFVETRARVSPEVGAAWIEVAGTLAMFDGVHSPCTQTFCLGIFAPVTGGDLDRIEAFYRERGAPVFHEISPLADPSALALLNERGYRPIEFTSVMHRPIGSGVPLPASPNEAIEVRLARENEHELWARTATRGWSELAEFADIMLDLSRVSAARPNALSFLAELAGQPIATGAMTIHDGVALLAGASTIPEARNQGAQAALLQSRLRYAVDQGCDIAMMCALPGSASQRNAERQGFRIAYTRIKWSLAERP